MIFPNLCIFSYFVISIIDTLRSDDGDIVCCRVISEMLHALETRLSFKFTRLHGNDKSNALES